MLSKRGPKPFVARSPDGASGFRGGEKYKKGTMELHLANRLFVCFMGELL